MEMDIEMDIKNYLIYCQYRKELNNNTLKAYRIDLTQYAEFVQEESLKKSKIEEYITDLHKKYMQKTIKRKLASIKAFYKYLEEEEILSNNPFAKIKVTFKEQESLPRIIPRGDIEKLLNSLYLGLNAVTDKRKFYRDITVIEMFFATGVRVYELSHLKRNDIDLTNGIIKILGKGGKERYVQIANPDVLKIINAYYESNKIQIEISGYFFVNNRGSRFKEQSIRNMINKCTRSAGIKIHITPHMFRHSVATYLLDEGVDIVYIQKILGHSSIKTTQIYLHVTSKMQMEILKQKHPRNNMNIIQAA